MEFTRNYVMHIEVASLFSNPRVSLFSKDSFNLRVPNTFNTVALQQLQPTLSLLRNGVLLNLHIMLDKVEKCLWGQITQTIAVLRYPLLFLAHLEHDIENLVSLTKQIKKLSGTVYREIVFYSMKILQLQYRLRNLMHVVIVCKLVAYSNTFQKKFLST